MKVLILNGSPRADGNTRAALEECAAELGRCGVEAELFDIGDGGVPGCRSCNACAKLGRCVIDDAVNAFAEKLRAADGLIVGTPVYYASPNGSLISFLDRLFYSCQGDWAHKPAAGVAIARRSGSVASIDVLNKYFTIAQMPVVSSTYWNNAFGLRRGESPSDAEGMQTMRNLARNMAWLLKCIALGRENGIAPPKNDRSTSTNFIR